MGSCRQPSDSDVVRPPSVGRLRALEPITRPDGGAGGLKPRLQATLAVPVLPQHVAPRTRLSELIERTSDRLLTLVSAPAGYGKTTAVATWANSRPVPDALLWASVTDVERGSDKPWPFISAVAQYAAAARSDGTRTNKALVLDCASELTDIHADMLNEILEACRPGVRLILLTRADPPVDLESYRRKHELAEIRARDLAFNYKEAETLFVRRGLSLSAHETQVLLGRTRGWAAGLALAAKAVTQGSDADKVAREMGSTPGPVAEYLLAEVVDRQPAPVRQFLLRTSVAHVLEPDLVDALAGPGARTVLNSLVRRNALMEQVPGSAEYRYHPLFKEVLQAQLSFETPEDARSLHREAAAHSARVGLITEAVRSSISAGSWPDAMRHVTENAAIADVLTPDPTELQSLLRPAPDLTGPEAAVIRAALAAGQRRPGECGKHLEQARRSLAAGSGSVGTELAVAITSAIHATFSDDWIAGRTAVESADRLWSRVDASRRDKQPCFDIVLETARARMLMWEGLFTGAERACKSVIARGIQPHFEWQYLDCLSLLAFSAAWQGRTGETLSLVQRAKATRLSSGQHPTAQPPATYAALALVFAELKELPKAQRYADAALAVPDVLIDGTVRAVVGLVSSRIRRSRGDRAGASAFLVIAEQGVTMPRWLGEQMDVDRSFLDGGEGARSSAGNDGSSVAGEVDRWLRRTGGQLHRGQRDQALSSLGEALRLADGTQLRRPFVEAPTAIKELLQSSGELMRRHSWLGSNARTPSRRRGAPKDERFTRASPASEPLTGKEREVLGYLAELFTTEEIAGAMFVSVNTVRTHVRNILRKLGASRRNEAIRRARDLGILSGILLASGILIAMV